MWNRIPFETVYFCANCEEEVVGLRAGYRIHSGRPLCLRCTHIGLEEGWAQSQEQSAPKKRVYETSRKLGIIVLTFFVGALGLVIWSTLSILKK